MRFRSSTVDDAEDMTALFLLAVIRYQMEKNSLDEAAELASIGGSPLQVAMQKTVGKFLKQLLGRVGIAQRTNQVAADGTAVKFQELLLCLANIIANAFLGPANERPKRHNLT